MEAIPGIPFSFAEFDAEGRCIHPPEVPDDSEELIIASHGWNNDREEAEALYHELFSNFAAVKPAGVGKIAIVGVIWPSKKFDLGAQGTVQVESGLVNSASVGGTVPGARDAAIAQALGAFEQTFAGSGKDAQLANLRELSTRLGQPEARAQFVGQLRQLVGTADGASPADASDVFFGADPEDVFTNAGQASSEVGTVSPDGADGSGASASLGSLVGGVADAVSNLLNMTTYYEMKKRAGTVGTAGLAPMIDELAERARIRHIHLVGHSFGARLVTAAAMASTTGKLHSMSLLQAAFSHNGFSQQGYFRKVVKDHRFTGPVIITHTANDLAVGKAYAIASRISGDTTAGAGDANDKFGGLGRNGAQRMGTGEVSASITRMLAQGEAYVLQKQIIHNLESSPYIKGHGDVRGPAVAWAISQAIGTV